MTKITPPRKYFLVNGNAEYHAMFRMMGWSVTNRLEDADLVQFTGGEDVSPHMYGHTTHDASYCNPHRDREETLIAMLAKQMGIPMAGICRGGQFLNVLCGGKMYQHVDNHGLGQRGLHPCRDVITNDVFAVTSTHHQMMIPGEKAVIVGVAQLSRRREIMGKSSTPTIELLNRKIGDWMVRPPKEMDIEIVAYPEANVLCFQPHPEFPNQFTLARRYFDYIERYLFPDKEG